MPGKKHRRGTQSALAPSPPRDLARCPTPTKRAFSSRPEAMRTKRADPGPRRLKPYRCACGWWHLTTAQAA